MFLEINGLTIPVEEGSASGGNSARVPLRNEYGGAENASFGVSRNWKCKTSFLTRDEADRLNALFVGYKNFSGRYAESWAGRGVSGVSTPFPVPYLGVRGTMVGSSSYIKCEGRVAGTEWVTRNLVVMDLEIYEVQPANSPMDTTYDSGEQPGATPIPDPNPGNGGGENPFEQLPFVEPPRNPDGGYVTGVPYGPIYGEPGPFYDAEGNEIAAYGGDAPSDGVYYANGAPARNRVHAGSYGGKATLTRDPDPQGFILNFSKAFTGPGELTFKYMVDTNPYDGGLTIYAQGDDVGYRMLVQQQRQSDGPKSVSVILPRAQVWRVFFGFVGENPDFPSGEAGTNTFHVWDLNFEPSAIDPDDDQTPSTGDDLGERNDYANTVPSGKVNIGGGYFSFTGDTLTEPRTGKSYTSTHAWVQKFNQYMSTPSGMTPGSVAILRKRLSGPGTIGFQTSITAFAGNAVWRLTTRVCNLDTNFTYAMRAQDRQAQFARVFDVCGGTPELQVIAELVSGVPDDTEMNCWITKMLDFAEGAGHGPALHNENPYPAPDSDGDGVDDDNDPFPYDPSLDGVPNPDDPYDRDNPAPLEVPAGMTEISDLWYYDPLYSVGFDIIPGGYNASDPDTGWGMSKRFQGPGVLTYDLDYAGNQGYFSSIWQTANLDYKYGFGSDGLTSGQVVLEEDRVYEVQFSFYTSETNQNLRVTNIVFTPS